MGRASHPTGRLPGRLLGHLLGHLLLAGLALACLPAVAGPAPLVVKLIALNDFHGHLQSPGSFGTDARLPPAERPPVGGADALAAEVRLLEARNPEHVVVGAGDLIGASPMISGLFFDEPAVEVLNRIGVEFSSVGNHEFDKGAAELKRMQHGGCKRDPDGAVAADSCKGLGSKTPGSFDGAHFSWLAANVTERATGRTVLPPYGIKRFYGVPVAFVGVTLKETPALVTPSGVAGLEFGDEAAAINALVPRLHARGVHAIVALVHQGGWQPADGVGDINGCERSLRLPDGSDSPIGRIVSRLDDGIDLVISAHTHAAYNCSARTVDARPGAGGKIVRAPRPTGLPNRSGRLVPVTSAGAFGRLLSDIDLRIDRRTHRVLSVAATNRLVDRDDPEIAAAMLSDPGMRRIVDGYAELVAPLAGRVIGSLGTALPNRPDSAGEMQAGDLIADSQLRATQPAAQGGAVMAFMNPGGIRTPGFDIAGAGYPYALRFGDAFAVQPFGNSLVTMDLSARQLKDLLEQQFPGCGGQDARRILQVSNGIRYAWRDSAPPCARIVDLSFTPTDLASFPPVRTGPAQQIVADGVLVDPARIYRVSVNDFLAAGGDGFSVLREGARPLGGPASVDALADYLGAGFLAPKPAYDPALPALATPRIQVLP